MSPAMSPGPAGGLGAVTGPRQVPGERRSDLLGAQPGPGPTGPRWSALQRSVLGGREGDRDRRPEAVFQGDVARVEVPARVDDVGGQRQLAVLPGAVIRLGRDDQLAGRGLVNRVQRADIDVEP